MSAGAAQPGAGQLAERLRAAVSDALGEDCTVEGLVRLSGGASRETWAFDARCAGGEVRPLILRRDPPESPKQAMVLEGRALRAAAAVGVPVPALLTATDDPGPLGSAFLVVERVEGETIARRILRDDALTATRPLLAAQCGEIIARLQQVPVDDLGLEHVNQLDHYRQTLDELGEPHPAFELGFRALEATRPPPRPPVVVHGDFRHGNLIIGADGVRAVLDWELVHAGNPMEDLGWLCVKAWRYGAPLPVGGFGTYEQLAEGYERAGGEPLDLDELAWWEALGTLRWGIICMVQADFHLSGAVRSVELAAIGRRVCETEHDLLSLLDGRGSLQRRAPRR